MFPYFSFLKCSSVPPSLLSSPELSPVLLAHHLPLAVPHLPWALCWVQVWVGDVTVTCRAMCSGHHCHANPSLPFLWQAENHLPLLPALPASSTLSLSRGRGSQKQYLNLEALWGIRKQCDFSASCITMRKGHSLPLMTFYVHEAMSQEL